MKSIVVFSVTFTTYISEAVTKSFRSDGPTVTKVMDNAIWGGNEVLCYLQAMFEVITSEASYIKSLGILINHFMDKPELNPNCPDCVLEKSQYRILFCNVKAIKEMSERYLNALRQFFFLYG